MPVILSLFYMPGKKGYHTRNLYRPRQILRVKDNHFITIFSFRFYCYHFFTYAISHLFRHSINPSLQFHLLAPLAIRPPPTTSPGVSRSPTTQPSLERTPHPLPLTPQGHLQPTIPCPNPLHLLQPLPRLLQAANVHSSLAP